LVQMKTLKFAFKINWPLIVPPDFQTFLRSWLRGNSAKQKQCFCIFWLAFRTLFPKVQWERPIKSKWVEPWTFGSIDLKCCIWWFWIRTFDIYEIIWKVSTYHVHTVWSRVLTRVTIQKIRFFTVSNSNKPFFF
jgi:hypothetical protein